MPLGWSRQVYPESRLEDGLCLSSCASTSGVAWKGLGISAYMTRNSSYRKRKLGYIDRNWRQKVWKQRERKYIQGLCSLLHQDVLLSSQLEAETKVRRIGLNLWKGGAVVGWIGRAALTYMQLPCVKQTASRKLLHSAGSSARFCDDLEAGMSQERLRREETYVHGWFISLYGRNRHIVKQLYSPQLFLI